MLKFFRRIRQSLLSEGNTGKYFKYAIGEIVLVVIGILIALQINNWNENSGIDKQVKNYRFSLLSEIEKDLTEIDRIDSLNLFYTNQINHYFSVYNSPGVDMDSLLSIKNVTKPDWNNFQSNLFSIDELITSGNISFFDHEEKLAIITLKKQIELYTFYEKQEVLIVTNRWDRYEDLVDLAFQAELTKKENKQTQKQSADIDSDYYQHFNNALTLSLDYYKYQDHIYSARIRPELIHLKTILSENME